LTIEFNYSVKFNDVVSVFDTQRLRQYLYIYIFIIYQSTSTVRK